MDNTNTLVLFHTEYYQLELAFVNLSTMSVTVRVTLRLSVCLGVEPVSGRLTRYCFLFKCLGLEFVVLSLWGALSDERSGLSFVSRSLVICLCTTILRITNFT
jgi:hypothetical protein